MLLSLVDATTDGCGGYPPSKYHLRIDCCCVSLDGRESGMDVRGQEDVGFRRPACKSFCHLDLSPLNGQGRFPEINVMDKWFIHS